MCKLESDLPVLTLANCLHFVVNPLILIQLGLPPGGGSGSGQLLQRGFSTPGMRTLLSSTTAVFRGLLSTLNVVCHLSDGFCLDFPA